jgi:DNA-binding MarR family transcriptional regulator
MEQAGHVRVKPDRDDARRRPVALTGPGRRLHDRIITLELAREEKLLTGLKPAERKSLLNLLTRLRANLATLAE